MRSPFMRPRRQKPSELLLDRVCRRRFELFEESDQIERCGEHRQLTRGRTWPLLARAIPIKLDAVVVGVAQIKRFADAMI